MDALELAQSPRAVPQEPAPLPHLDWKDASQATFDIALTLQLIRKLDLSSQDRRTELEISNIMSRGWKTFHLTDTNLNELYWTPYQQLTHLGKRRRGPFNG